jgi:methylmalonyl-CoA mutase N-terminal domain/subunit
LPVAGRVGTTRGRGRTLVHVSDDAHFQTDSGIEVKALYDASDLAGWDPEAQLGAPGNPPYNEKKIKNKIKKKKKQKNKKKKYIKKK